MKYRVIHRTEYEYSDTATVCHNIAHLSPRSGAGQYCSSHYLSVVPQPTVLEERIDHFGNQIYYFSIERPHKKMEVTATSTVEPGRAGEAPSTVAWASYRDDLADLPPAAQLEARAFMLESPMIPSLPQLTDYARPSFERYASIRDAARDLMRRIFEEFTYDPAFTTLATPLADVIAHKRGVCQDFSHLAIGCLRAYGLSARYISGYLETLPPPGQAKLVGADASHAWLSVHLPDAGWLDLDPTNNQHPDDRYIITGWGRDYSDVPPLKGVIFGGGTPRMTVAVDVERLH
ncbi:MAG TPA: transglutaminase family protein [Kiritimatiellia bacterium]|nr:transglutaminase family protein [Kiritimatiellia bacterium]HMO97719.1 transglutaminase family protein [Kiritimatiellia bacterium]HMP97983.1 transglutaminase family protein [Kiritimatiellia bacterium]